MSHAGNGENDFLGLESLKLPPFILEEVKLVREYARDIINEWRERHLRFRKILEPSYISSVADFLEKYYSLLAENRNAIKNDANQDPGQIPYESVAQYHPSEASDMAGIERLGLSEVYEKGLASVRKFARELIESDRNFLEDLESSLEPFHITSRTDVIMKLRQLTENWERRWKIDADLKRILQNKA
jgi:hypothetical protein